MRLKIPFFCEKEEEEEEQREEKEKKELGE